MMANATEEQQRRILELATPEQLAKWDADFEHWAHKNQLPPTGEGWTTWLMMAGRGFGKTRAGAEWIFRLGEARPGSLIALAGATIGDARTIMVEGVSGLIAVAKRYRRRLRWESSLRRLSWPNGSKAQLFSGDNPDGLRGPEHDFAWVLTFEVVGVEAPPSVAAIVADVTGGWCKRIPTRRSPACSPRLVDRIGGRSAGRGVRDSYFRRRYAAGRRSRRGHWSSPRRCSATARVTSKRRGWRSSKRRRWRCRHRCGSPITSRRTTSSRSKHGPPSPTRPGLSKGLNCRRLSRAGWPSRLPRTCWRGAGRSAKG